MLKNATAMCVQKEDERTSNKTYAAIQFSDFQSALNLQEFVLVWEQEDNIQCFHHQAFSTAQTRFLLKAQAEPFQLLQYFMG